MPWIDASERPPDDNLLHIVEYRCIKKTGPPKAVTVRRAGVFIGIVNEWIFSNGVRAAAHQINCWYEITEPPLKQSTPLNDEDIIHE